MDGVLGFECFGLLARGECGSGLAGLLFNLVDALDEEEDRQVDFGRG